jgi:excisionase family DNA binding protein
MGCAADRELLAGGAVGIPEASTFSGLGRTFLYSLMERGQLRYVKAGKRRLIPRIELTRMLAERLVDPTDAGSSTY